MAKHAEGLTTKTLNQELKALRERVRFLTLLNNEGLEAEFAKHFQRFGDSAKPDSGAMLRRLITKQIDESGKALGAS